MIPTCLLLLLVVIGVPFYFIILAEVTNGNDINQELRIRKFLDAVLKHPLKNELLALSL
jgi:hypothetical protein